jgi:membrane protein
MSKLALTGTISSMVPAAFRYVPYLLILILYTLIYVLIPNTRVKLRSGVYAGIVASICFSLIQWGYIHFQIGISRYNAIYGSLAALPLLLIWLQLSWVILLGGAEISYADQNVDIYEYEPDYLQVSHRYKGLLTLHVAYLLVKRFIDGKPPATAEQISHELELPFRLTSDILTDLLESGLISNTCLDHDDESAYQPASDVSQWTLDYVIDALDRRGINEIPVAHTAALESLSENLKALESAVKRSPANKLLKDL